MHEQYLRRALRLAEENVQLGRGGPFGAVLVRDGAIVAEGANLVTSTCDPTAHAEVVAIREACRRLGRFDLRGATLYASCEPCPMCLAAIYWARIESLYFAATRDDAAAVGFDDGFLYAEIPLPLAARRLPSLNLLREESGQAFALWRAAEAKTPY